MKYALAFSLLAACSLAACVNQDKEVAQYRAVLAGHAPVTTRPAARSIDSGDTLTLSDAMALASRDNERLSLAGEEYLQALIDKDRAFANFLPTLSFAPSYAASESYDEVKYPSPGFRQHSLDAPVNLNANVNGVRDWSLVRAARLTAEQRKELLLDLQATVLLETAQVYYQILRAERAVDVLTHSLSVQEAHVRDVSDKLAQGVVRQLDLEQARAQAASTRVQLTDARNAVATGRSTLAFLLGVPAVRGTLRDTYLLPTRIPTLDEWLRNAQDDRRDLRAAHQAVLAARQGVNAAIGQYYPSVHVNLDAFLYRESVPDDSSLAALIGLQLPLFSAGRIHADVRTAWSQFRQSLLARSLLTRQVREQVERAHADFLASTQRVADLETEVAAAAEAARIAAESYNTGLTTNLDYLDAQDRLLSAQLQLAGGRFDKVVRYLNLRRVTGQLDGPHAAATAPAASQAAPQVTAHTPQAAPQTAATGS